MRFNGTRARKASWTVGLAGLALATAACGGSSGGGSEIQDADEVSADGENLTVWIMEGTNPDAGPYSTRSATAFTEETGAKLDVQFVPWADAHDKFVNVDRRRHHARRGRGRHHLDPRVRRRRRARRPHRRRGRCRARTTTWSPASQEAGTVDGELYGMPWYAGVRSVVYRTDVFEEAGRRARRPRGTSSSTVGKTIKAGQPRHDHLPGARATASTASTRSSGAPAARSPAGRRRLESAPSTQPEAQEGITFYTDLALKHGFSSPGCDDLGRGRPLRRLRPRATSR